MSFLSGAARILFGRRRASWRGLALVPGVVALLFAGHAVEDAGPVGALPYLAIILLSASYVIRPMVAVWLPLFGAFVAYGVIVAGLPENGPRDEWILFMLLGFVPAALLWVARPRVLFGERSRSSLDGRP
jgi:hypothetical protein